MKYWLTGLDGNEYGPVDMATLNQWAKENRAHGDSLVRAETSTEKVALKSLPDFVAPQPAVASAPPPSAAPAEAPVAAKPVPGHGASYEELRASLSPTAQALLDGPKANFKTTKQGNEILRTGDGGKAFFGLSLAIVAGALLFFLLTGLSSPVILGIALVNALYFSIRSVYHGHKPGWIAIGACVLLLFIAGVSSTSGFKGLLNQPKKAAPAATEAGTTEPTAAQPATQ